MQARFMTFVSVIVVIALALGISIGYSLSSQQTYTTTDLQTTTVTAAFSSNSNYTTWTFDCAGFPVCGISSNYYFGDSTTTVVVFEYPGSSTTSYETLTLSHPNSTTQVSLQGYGLECTVISYYHSLSETAYYSNITVSYTDTTSTSIVSNYSTTLNSTVISIGFATTSLGATSTYPGHPAYSWDETICTYSG